jgi:hypothetical protein
VDVLIELGEVPRPRELPGGGDPGRQPFPARVVLGLLAAVLLAALGGAGHRTPPEPPRIIAARLGDAAFLEGDQLYVISAGRPVAGSRVLSRTVSTYSVPEARLLSRTTVEVSGGVLGVWQATGAVLVAYQVDTSGTWAVVALAVDTDRVLWRRAARLVGVSAADRLVVLETADAELGVDLPTGRTRWSVPHPADGFTAHAGIENGFPRWLVTATDSGRLETRDAHTGRILGEVALPRRPGRANGVIWPVGDLVLVDTFGSGFDAFRLPGLQRVWRTPVDLSQSWMQADCVRLICTFHRQWGMTVLDPATGRELWTSDRWEYAEPTGSYLLASVDDRSRAQPSLWVLDAATGQALGNFGDWKRLGSAGNGMLYGLREDRDTHRIHYGVLDPATRAVHLLGAADRVSGGCETGAAVLICRLVDASVAVWDLR